MIKKYFLTGLIIGVVSILLVGRVYGQANSNKTLAYLDTKQFVWVGNKTGNGEPLKPVTLTGKLAKVLTQQEYALSTAIEETVDVLIETKRASTSQVKQFFTAAININPQVETIEGNRILAKTGGAGVVEFEAEKGRYSLQIAPVDGININLPASVNINLEEYIIPIGINGNGNGSVKRLAGAESFIQGVSAQEGGNSKVKIAMYFDKNNNGEWDTDENVAPWAGVRVDLVNMGKQSGITLSDQWKDVYLDNAKAGMKASDLVNDLGQNCPTAGVSAIDGDTRKTFMKREGEVFGSAEDFEITGGKVYSIKGCDVPFYIIGYDLEKQFEK